MNQLAVAGLAIGGVVLLSQDGGTVVVGQSAGDAAKAACDSLRAAMPIAGITWQVPSTNDPSSAYLQMREAFVGAYGQLSGVAGVYPRDVSIAQLELVLRAWLDAFKAGCSASSTAGENFNLSANASPDFLNSCDPSYWKFWTRDALSVLGQAVYDVASYRDELGSTGAWDAAKATATPEEIQETFRRVNALASEMSGADFAFPGTRSSDKRTTFDDVLGGIAAAGGATAEFVGGLAGKAAGAVAGAVVSSPLFWFVGLGLAGYLVLKRSA